MRVAGVTDNASEQVLSGQQQRVTIGCAIVGSPRVFPKEESLSNLDAALRVAMRAEVRRPHCPHRIITVLRNP